MQLVQQRIRTLQTSVRSHVGVKSAGCKILNFRLAWIGNNQCILKSHVRKGRMPCNCLFPCKSIFHRCFGCTKVIQIYISIFIQNLEAVKLDHIARFSCCSYFNSSCHILGKINNRISCRCFENTFCRNTIHYTNLCSVLRTHNLCIKEYKLNRLPVAFCGFCL